MKPAVRVWSVLAAITLVLSVVVTAPQPTVVQAAVPYIRISQVYGGGGNIGATLTHDFIELYNPTGDPVSLAGWSVQYASATGSSWQVTALSGSIPANGYYLVQEAQGSGGSVALPTPDAIGTIPMSATNGKVALVNSTTELSGTCPTGQPDFVGYGSANCFEGAGATPALSNTTAALRNDNGCVDTGNNAADFTVTSPAPRNSASSTYVCPTGDAAPAVSSTTPLDGAADFPARSNLQVTFSEPVDVSPGWFDLSCSSSGSIDAAVSGGPLTFSLDPVIDLLDTDTCTLTIYAAQVTDQDIDDPPDALESDHVINFTALDFCSYTFTEIPAIQGSGDEVALPGIVTTQGVVVGDYEGPSPALRGFYLQSQAGDGDTATSDGIFVYNGNNDSVALGDVVRVSGNASDYQGQTQISATSIIACGTGSAAPMDVTFPVASDTFLERYEGMLVRLSQTLYVTEHFQLGRFGQVVVSSSDRLWQPTNILPPGTEADALQAANNLSRIIIDDALNNQNPDPILFGRGGLPLSASNTLRGGDTITNAVGVMTYTWAGNSASGNAFRLRPVNAMGGSWDFTAVNQRPTAPAEVGSELKVATLNVLNYFNTFTGCTLGVGGDPTDCRGAGDSEEFERQSAKIVSAILKMDSAVVGLVEIENDGYGAESAIADLVDQLNTASAPGTYSFIDVDFNTSQVNALGTDAIKVGLIYQPALVTPTGDTAALNTEAFVNGGDAEARNRPALAQTFIDDATGKLFTVVVNHLKSKGSACDDPDAGDLQGNCNLVRVNAATELANWLAGDPTGTGVTSILIMGDLNAYAKEDPIAALETAGYSNMLAAYQGAGAYTYVFDGQWGNLDHALASPSMRIRITGVTSYHINADEPGVLDYNTDYKTEGQVTSLYASDEFRASDHDAIIVGLKLDIFEVYLPLISR